MSSESAIAAYWNFFEAFNSRDARAFSAALNYPHVRVSSRGLPAIVPSLEDHAASISWERFLATGWDHTNGHEPELLHEAEDCAHIVGGWTRVDAQDNPVLVNRVTYIVTRTNAGWGIQCRYGTDAGTAQSSGETEAAHARAVALVEDYIDAYNNRDWQRCASLMATPHFQVDVGAVREWQDRDGLQAALRDGSRHAVTEVSARAVQGGPNSVTVAIEGVLDSGDRTLKAVFFLVNRDDWGIQARSIIEG